MKKLIYLIGILSIFGVLSCTSGPKSNSNNEKAEAEVIKDCDEFLKHYEDWGDKYIEVIDAYSKDPTNEKIAIQYMDLMQEALEWSAKWINLSQCADKKEYADRFEAVAQEVAEKLQEMGL